jgi:general nucleoside transport system permease protein
VNWRGLGLQLLLILVPLAISLALTALLILLLGQDPIEVLRISMEGAFRDSKRVAIVFDFWIPLTLVSVGLVVTFVSGLWNIGIEGQMMMGAVFASWGARYLNLPEPILLPAIVAVAAIGGMLWALLVGWLKLRFGVHEIFGGVALNAIANTFAIWLISGPWLPPEGGSAQSTPPFPSNTWLPLISDDFPVNGVMIALTVLSVVVVLFILNGTRWGLTLKASGKNARSAYLLGVPTGRIALAAFAFAGIMAGLAGSYRVLHTYHALRPLVSGGIGFLGLLVVLLVSFNALLVPLVTFALAALIAGSTRVKILLQLDQSLVGVLQGLIVLLIMIFNGLRERIPALRNGAQERIESADES